MSFFSALLAQSGYDHDYQALLDYYTANALTHPSASKKTKENAFMIAVKAAFGIATSGNIADAPILQMLMFKTDAASGASLVNWVTPGTRNATNSGATFTSDLGWNSSGSPDYIISGLTIGDINQADFSLAIRAYTNTAVDNSIITGAGDATNGDSEALSLNPRNSSDNFSFKALGSSTAIQGSNSDATARFVFGRTDASNVHHSLNGASLTTTANAANAMESTGRDINILAFAGSSRANYFTRGVSYRIFGSRTWTNAEIAALDAAIVNYLS